MRSSSSFALVLAVAACLTAAAEAAQPDKARQMPGAAAALDPGRCDRLMRAARNAADRTEGRLRALADFLRVCAAHAQPEAAQRVLDKLQDDECARASIQTLAALRNDGDLHPNGRCAEVELAYQGHPAPREIEPREDDGDRGEKLEAWKRDLERQSVRLDEVAEAVQRRPAKSFQERHSERHGLALSASARCAPIAERRSSSNVKGSESRRCQALRLRRR
jgi:hypothetical protein